MHRIAVSVLVAATAVVPWAFTTRNEDVFTLPKLVSLWVVLAAVTWLVMIGELWRDGTRMLPFRPVAAVDGLVLAFLVLNVVATAFSTDPSQSLIGEPLQHQGLLTLLLCIAWFYAARVLVTTAGRIDALFGAVTVGAVVVAAYAVVQELGLDPVWDGDVPGGRVFSTIGQPNALAAYLVVGIPGALALAARRGGPVRILALSGAGLMVVAVALTSSRGGYLGLAVTAPLAALAWVHRDRRRQWGRVSGTLTVAAMVVLFCVLVPAVRTAVADSWSAPARSRLAAATSRSATTSTSGGSGRASLPTTR